jgi:hypothetical protein
MKRFIPLFVIAILSSYPPAEAQANGKDIYSIMRERFLNPAGTARPKVYWWCLNGNIDTARAKEEMIAMKNAGIGGFDLFEIGVPKQDVMIPAGPAFLSDESLKIIGFVVKEAGKLGLTVGLNLASSWNAGGSWVKPEHAGKSLYYSKTGIKGNSEVQRIILPFPEVSLPESSLVGGTGKQMIPFRSDGRPEYYEEVAVLAIPADIKSNSLDTSRVINITGYFDAKNDILTWNAPAGSWEIHRYVCSNSGQQLVLPSRYSAGLTIDHFDSTAVRSHLMYIISRLMPVTGDFRKTALKSFYLASYEARGFVWTSTLPSEFKKVNGYDIYKSLPSLFNPELFSREHSRKLQADFRKTLSELMINNLYKNARRICNSYGLKINCEAGGPGYPLYNGPSEPLRALGALDIPRGEFWVNHSRYYPDSNRKDSIDIMRVVKEVSAASHIYGRRIAEEESFTSFQHWQEGPFDIKPFGDRAFCEGMNRVVFHGFSHNPAGTGFPGIVYHAGTHFNDKRVWWPMAKPFIDYISRISYIAQTANFISDVLFYYGDRLPNAVNAKNTHFTAGAGYDYEVVNTEILLNNVTVRQGKLVLSTGAQFSILVLDKEETINPAVLIKLDELARQGAIILGAKPERVAESAGKTYPKTRIDALLNNLWSDITDPAKAVAEKKGKIFSGLSPSEMLNALQIPPDFTCTGKESPVIDFIHYNNAGLDFYLVRNTTDHWISKLCGFRQQLKVPAIWNPVTGETVPVTVYKQAGKYIDVPVSLAPYGCYFIVFRNAPSAPLYTDISAENNEPPLIEFTRNGIIAMDRGIIELKRNSETRKMENNKKIRIIDGEWHVSFSKGWGAPDSAVFPELISWTDHKDEGIRYYSGMGTYRKTFLFDNKPVSSEDQRIFLDLGRISKTAEVWLNGHYLGILWAKPFRCEITGELSAGNNELIVKVANTWSNRLTGDAITGNKFTNTNITGLDRLPWAKVPLIESGLLGPVTIETLNVIH